MSLHWPAQPNLLASYAYVHEWGRDLSIFHGTNLIVDSGAFTAASKGTRIDLDEYCEWLLAHRDIVAHAAVLDVIGDWKATARNMERMEARLGENVNILPAWHLGSPQAELDRLTKTYPYLAIGGAVPYASREKILMRELIRAHRSAREHGARLHGLGITGGKSLRRLPWSTADSSSWAQAFRYGTLQLSRADGTFERFPVGKPITRDQATLVRIYGGDPDEVTDKSFCYLKYSTQEVYDRQRYWVGTAMARAQWVVEGVLRRKHKTDLHIHLADPAHSNHVKAIAGHGMGHPFERTP